MRAGGVHEAARTGSANAQYQCLGILNTLATKVE